ncbi:MAG: hypothetical protein O2885_11695 [Proteobacteria bacterium]|jgi:hypothetical protein|nr:hypothetical protein [Pseudomonadota bacterium]
MTILTKSDMNPYHQGLKLMLLLLIVVALWIPQTIQANTVILEDMVVSKCFRQGLCEMGYAAGVPSKEAQRFGFHLPKLMVQLREFEEKSLLRLDPNCFKDAKWQTQLWEATVAEMQEKNIKLVGEKFRRSLITYTYVNGKSLGEILRELRARVSC